MLNETIINGDDIQLTKFSAINESTGKKRKGVLSTVEGDFMEFGVINRNNRYYDSDIGEKYILQNSYVKEMLKNKTLLGEAQHPLDRSETVTTNASHCITDLWMSEDKKFLKGRMDILDTPAGRVVQTLIDYGATLGVSARASGKLIKKTTKDGQTMFVIDEGSYVFTTFDIVLEPGFQSARLDVVNEMKNNREIIYNFINESLNDISDIAEYKKAFAENKLICEAVSNKEVELMKDNKADNNAELLDKYNQLNESFDVILNENRKLKARVIELKDEISSADMILNQENKQKNEFSSMNESLKNTVNEQKERIHICTESMKMLNENLNMIRLEMQDLNEELEQKESEIDQLNEELTVKSSEVDILNERCDRLQGVHALNGNADKKECAVKKTFINESDSAPLKMAKKLPVLESVVHSPVSVVDVTNRNSSNTSNDSEQHLSSLLKRVKNK